MVRLDRLKALCKQNGIKQKHLFALVGKPEWYGGDIKKGVTVPDTILETWAEALNTSVEYLLGETDIKEKAPTNSGEDFTNAEILEAFNRADEKTKEAIRLLLGCK